MSAVSIALLLAAPAAAQQFYPDDPLTAEPPPFPVIGPEGRALSEILELVSNTLGNPGERHPDGGIIPARGINTLGEVLDGPWFVNRHATRRLSREELIAGPGRDHAPSGGVFRVDRTRRRRYRLPRFGRCRLRRSVGTVLPEKVVPLYHRSIVGIHGFFLK